MSIAFFLVRKIFSLILFSFYSLSVGAGTYPIPCDEDTLNVALESQEIAIKMVDRTLKVLEESDFGIFVGNLSYNILGARSSSDEEKILARFIGIRTWLPNIRFLCYSASHPQDNSDGIFAAVHPDDDLLVVYIGAYFLRAEDEGLDSKAGTLIHEVAHLLVAGASDYFFIEPEPLDLDEVLEIGKNDPDRALQNANGLEYFAEIIYFDLLDELE